MIVRALGIVLMGVALWDVFVTVLYARARGGMLARSVSYLTWQLFLGAGRVFPRGQRPHSPFLWSRGPDRARSGLGAGADSGCGTDHAACDGGGDPGNEWPYRNRLRNGVVCSRR